MKHPFIVAFGFGLVLNVTPNVELRAATDDVKPVKDTKDYLQVSEDVSTKQAPVDTHADFSPLHPADNLHSESPILRDNLQLQDAPPSLAKDVTAMNPEPEADLALKPRKTKHSH